MCPSTCFIGMIIKIDCRKLPKIAISKNMVPELLFCVFIFRGHVVTCRSCPKLTWPIKWYTSGSPYIKFFLSSLKLTSACNNVIVTQSPHLHEQQPHDEGWALAVAHLPVMEGVRLHHVEQTLLPQPVLLLEEVMLRVRPGNVPPDDLMRAQRKKMKYYSSRLLISLVTILLLCNENDFVERVWGQDWWKEYQGLTTSNYSYFLCDMIE